MKPYRKYFFDTLADFTSAPQAKYVLAAIVAVYLTALGLSELIGFWFGAVAFVPLTILGLVLLFSIPDYLDDRGEG